MDLLPKRITVFLDSTHGEQTDNRVTHLLTEAIETDDDEALVVRIIHAQIPTPYPIWIEEGQNILVLGVFTGNNHKHANPLMSAVYAAQYNGLRRRKDAKSMILQEVFYIPVGGDTPESLATTITTMVQKGFSIKQAPLDVADYADSPLFTGADTVSSGAYQMTFPFDGLDHLPLAYFREAPSNTQQPSFEQIMTILGQTFNTAIVELKTNVTLKYDRANKRFFFEVTPRDLIGHHYVNAHDHQHTTAGDKFAYPLLWNFKELYVVNLPLDGNGALRLGEVSTSHALMDILGIPGTPTNPVGDTDVNLTGEGVSGVGDNSETIVNTNNRFYRLAKHADKYDTEDTAFYNNPTGHHTNEPTVLKTMSYPVTTRNIHVKTNLATNSVVDSFLGSKTNTLAVIPAHSAELGFHYAGAADSIFSSMITTNSINRIIIDLTDEHNVPLDIGGDEFTIGLEMQYVRIGVLQNELKDVRDRRLYIHEKQKDEKKRAHRNVKTKRRERNKKKKIKKVINTIRKKDGNQTTGK